MLLIVKMFQQWLNIFLKNKREEKEERMKNRKNKSGEMLVGNVVFILLNAVFIFILILFLLKQGEGAVVLEQTHAKQIALLVDSAQPGMTIRIDMEKAMNIAENRGIDFWDIVDVDRNVVLVKLTDKSGYSYSFFNEVNLRAYPELIGGEYTGLYILEINEK